MSSRSCITSCLYIYFSAGSPKAKKKASGGRKKPSAGANTVKVKAADAARKRNEVQ